MKGIQPITSLESLPTLPKLNREPKQKPTQRKGMITQDDWQRKQFAQAFKRK